MKTALAFYEDDEDPRELLAVFEAGEKSWTSSSAVLVRVEWREA
ncbi:hypothetical protein ACFWYW_59175 [Nonomuraea sp. NPDC059023]